MCEKKIRKSLSVCVRFLSNVNQVSQWISLISMSVHVQCSFCTYSVEGFPSLVCGHILSVGASLISVHWQRWHIFGEGDKKPVTFTKTKKSVVFIKNTSSSLRTNKTHITNSILTLFTWIMQYIQSLQREDEHLCSYSLFTSILEYLSSIHTFKWTLQKKYWCTGITFTKDIITNVTNPRKR